MKTVLAAAVAASALFAAPAFAQDAPAPVFADPTFYVNLGGLRIDGEDADVNAVVGRGGVRFNRFVGAEAELAFGVGKDDVKVGTQNFEVKLEHEFAGYVVGFVPVSPNADIFGRIGIGMIEVNAETTPSNLGAKDDVQTWNYGVGAQFFWDGLNGIRGEFTRAEVFDDEDFADQGFNIWSIAYVRKFGG